MTLIKALLPLLCTLATKVSAQAPGLFADQSCSQGQRYPPSVYPLCRELPGSGWGDRFPKDEKGNFIVYLEGDGLRDWDTIVFMDRDEPQTSTCGTPVATIDYQTRCKRAVLPFNFDFTSCNQNEDGEAGCAQIGIPDFRNISDDSTAPATTKRNHARDLALPIAKRQEGCSFSGGKTFEKFGAAQRLTNTLRCPADAKESCTFTEQVSRSVSSTNTFGTSVEASAEIFKIISVSVSFSYEYSFTQEKSQSSSYQFPVSPGQAGYLTWTPLLECVDGAFARTCNFNTGNGQACIPKFLSGEGTGEPRGEYGFIAELSP